MLSWRVRLSLLLEVLCINSERGKAAHIWIGCVKWLETWFQWKGSRSRTFHKLDLYLVIKYLMKWLAFYTERRCHKNASHNDAEGGKLNFNANLCHRPHKIVSSPWSYIASIFFATSIHLHSRWSTICLGKVTQLWSDANNKMMTGPSLFGEYQNC